MKQYFVVDQNILRKPELESMLEASSRNHFVVPDLAFLEMTKTDKWLLTLQKSLRLLAEYPNRAHVCLSVNEALEFELSTLRSIEGKMLFKEATAFFRDILSSVRTGNEGYAIARINSDPNGHRQTLAIDHLDHDKNKERLKKVLDSTSHALSDELKKRMRSGKFEDAERLDLIFESVKSLLPKILERHGISLEKARYFMKRKPMTLHICS